MRIENIPGGSVVYVRWLVQGNGPFTVRAKSVKGGISEKTVGRPE